MEDPLLGAEFSGEMLPHAAFVPVLVEVEETARAVPVIIPTGVVHDGVEANSDDVRPCELRLTNLC